MSAQYDVIIVGGRPAGASLAARLGQHGLRVLLLERASFPQRHPASSPVIYASSMALLDELEVSEQDYAANTPRLYTWTYEVRRDFRLVKRIPMCFGRDYAYAIDRAQFDQAIWNRASSIDTVTVHQPFTVTGLCNDGCQVTGVRGHAPDGTEETFTADWIVGADGRFSLVARSVNAGVFNERKDLPTTYLYAYWEKVELYDERPTIHLFTSGAGYGFLLMESADGTACVVAGGRSDRLRASATATDHYLHLLQRHPTIWKRLRNAQRVTTVHGMRNVGNLYRESSGPGWALVGDAVHQKDPIDGQGIYDALFSAKALSYAIIDWAGGRPRSEVLRDYSTMLHAETLPMYQLTMKRVEREIYTQHASLAYNTWIRWLFSDFAYQHRLGLLLTRGIDPEHWMPLSALITALGRGMWSDLRRLITGRSSSPVLPPFPDRDTPA